MPPFTYGGLIHLYREKDLVEPTTGAFYDNDFDLWASLEMFEAIGRPSWQPTTVLVGTSCCSPSFGIGRGGGGGSDLARSIKRLRRVSSGFLLPEVISVVAAAAAFGLCDSSGMMARYGSTQSFLMDVLWQLLAFLGLVCVSRAGLSAFKIGALEIEQHVVDERYRNAIGSVESALCSLLWMCVYVMSIAMPDPSMFGVQVFVSAAAVTSGWLCFVAFVCLYLSHGHYHVDCDEGEDSPAAASGHSHGHPHSHVHEHTAQQEKELLGGFHIHLHEHRSRYC